MKTVGLIGGISAESTKIYYDLLNAHARERMGGQHTAKLLFATLDYGEMYGHYQNENWAAFSGEITSASLMLKNGGAEALAIMSGTGHLAANAVAEATGTPVIHMLDNLSSYMDERGIKKPLLFGTPWVMSGPFFQSELNKRYGGELVTPTRADRDSVGHVIFEELVNGIVDGKSKSKMIKLVNSYAKQGADAVILGCTELCMILEAGDCDIPVLSNTHIHAAAIDKYIHSDIAL